MWQNGYEGGIGVVDTLFRGLDPDKKTDLVIVG